MEKQFSPAEKYKTLKNYVLGVTLSWTLVLGCVGLFFWVDHLHHIRANIIDQARDAFNKDLVFRRWAAGHGGVYVAPTKETPPNPYLSHLLHRDITTSDGHSLTLVNPAYMIRQVHELGLNQFGFRGHITSLRPLRPENRPDEWETKALNRFASGVNEVAEKVLIEGRPFIRLMKPLYAEESCLKCHGVQGYKIGELRGGTSVSISMEPLLARHYQYMFNFLGIVFLLWLAGVGFLYLSFQRYRKGLVKGDQSALQMNLLRRRYENIFSAAGEGILSLDRDYLHDFVNPAAAKMLGYARAELLGVSSHQSWHAFEAENLPYSLENCPVCQAMLDGREVKNFRDQFMRKDGSFFPVELSIAPILEEGVVQGAVVVFKDISKHLVEEARLQRLSSIIEQTHSAVAVVGLDGIIEYVNHAYEEISGYTIAEMLGRHPRDLFFTDENLAERQELWQAVSQGQSWRGILVSRRKDGALVYEDSTGFPLFNEAGEIINYVVIKYDVTEAKKLQEQLFQAQKMEAIGTLASGVAHDFNNLLTVINSFSETLVDECDPDSPIRSDLVEINQAGLRAADLTRQLLAFSRRQMIVPKELCLRRLINNLMKMMRRLLGEDIELSFDLPEPDKEILVVADSGQFEQVIVNLLVNARDAIQSVTSSEKDKKIVLRLLETELDSDYVALHEGSCAGRQALIEISDSGCGMSLDEQKHCFEPFYTTKELGQGTGLGLSTVYGIVKQNGGYINLYSEPGKGTTIKIYWPLSPESDVGIEAEVEESVKGFSVLEGMTILVAEDDDKIREIATTRLLEAGCKVISAKGGQEVLAKVRSGVEVPDILFTDMVMSGMDGVQLSLELRKLYPGLPVLFCSGYSDVEVVNGFGEGDAFLQKPYTIKSLLTALVKLVDV